MDKRKDPSENQTLDMLDPGWASSPSSDPVQVQLTISVKAIQEINAKRSTATVIVDFDLSWADPRVADAYKRDPTFRLPGDIWTPGLSIQNGINEQQYTLAASKDTRILDPRTGELGTEIIYSGSIDNPMDLKGFPFDEDSIDFRVAGSRLANGQPTDARDFVLRAKGGPKFAKFFFDSHLPEYQILEYICPSIRFSAMWNTFGQVFLGHHFSYLASISVESTGITSGKSQCSCG